MAVPKTIFYKNINNTLTFSFIKLNWKISKSNTKQYYDNETLKTVTNLNRQTDYFNNPENSSQQLQMTFDVSYILFSLCTIFWTCLSLAHAAIICLLVCLLLFVCYHVFIFLCFKYSNNFILRQYLLKSLYRGLMRDIIN